MPVIPYRDAEAAAIATSELLDLKDPPTCILYPDDFSALGGINEIHERGLRIPDDISIAGYDGLTFARILEPRLTTLCQDTETIGRLAAQKLIDLIENPKTTIIDKFTVDGRLFPVHQSEIWQNKKIFSIFTVGGLLKSYNQPKTIITRR